MKAVRYYRYGSPEVLELRDVDVPAIGDNDVLVRVRAAAVNPLDWHFMRGTPYVVRALAGAFRPKVNGLGVDMAGQVEAVGHNVTRFRAGDEVFGWRRGAFAEYVRVGEDAVMAARPANVTFEGAASVPVAGFTALQALRDKGRIKPGQKVLINGASGGVGTFAVQIAKACGVEVTGVCHPDRTRLRRAGRHRGRLHPVAVEARAGPQGRTRRSRRSGQRTLDRPSVGSGRDAPAFPLHEPDDGLHAGARKPG